MLAKKAGFIERALPLQPSANVTLGMKLAEQAGFGRPEQKQCLYNLWLRESGWDHTAYNENTGNNHLDADFVGRYADAYGIPQSLPPKKMASAGSDWRTNPATQIEWGLDYIEDRYKTPCNAWESWLQRGIQGKHHWY